MQHGTIIYNGQRDRIKTRALKSPDARAYIIRV